MILKSINSNVQLLKNRNIYNLILDWFKSFPYGVGQPLNISPKTTQTKSEALNPRIVIPPNHNVHEAVVKYFINEIGLLNTQVDSSKASICKLEAKLAQNKQAIVTSHSEFSGVLKEITLGGIKPQLFGLILVFYGSVISTFA